MPLQTALDNLEQKLTQMGSAATAVGLEDHRAMLAATRKRTREGHVAMANAAGTQLESEADEVGDLIMTGDIQLQKDADQPAATGVMKDLAKMIGAGAIGAGALLGTQIALDKPAQVVQDPPPVVQPALPDHTATIRPL
jgi:hypothetical protein